MNRGLQSAAALMSALLLALSAQAQVSPQDVAAANRGVVTEQGRDAAWHFGQHRKLNLAIDALKPQRPGVVDAYVVVAGFDSDPVFGREAAETAKVLARRFDAIGRTIVLSAGTGASDKTVPDGSPANFEVALGAVSARMDVKEDVLILYTTSHGAPEIGLSYRDGNQGFGWIGPKRLADLINGVGISRRMVMLSACFSGELLPFLVNDTSVIVTAADRDRTSFGCAPSNDWTFFGDALINTALRTPQPFDAAVAQAFDLIRSWEKARRLPSSQPQFYTGSEAGAWLDALEKRMPPITTPRVGKPAIDGG
jgi:hypothetical protein